MLSIPSLQHSPSLQHYVVHKWETTTFYQPTWCMQCNSFLYGFARQGLSCKNCLSHVHHDCSNDYDHRVPCDPSSGTHQWIEKTFHHIVNCFQCTKVIVGTGRLCIYCNSTSHNDPLCYGRILPTCPPPKPVEEKYKCDVCKNNRCSAHPISQSDMDTSKSELWSLTQSDPFIPEICQNSSRCTCECTIGSSHDVAQKAASIVGGLGLLAGSVAATVLTAGAAAPIFVPVLIGAGIGGGIGIASAAHGIASSVKKERIDAKDYGIDVGIGAVTGLVGVGTASVATAVGAVAATAAAANGAGAGVLLGVQGATMATTGAVGGVANQVVSDTIDVYAVKRKDQMDFGKNLALSALTGAVSGAVSVGATHVDTIASNAIKSGLANAGDDVVNLAATSATMVIKGGGKAVETVAKVGIQKELKKEEIEKDELITTAVTGLISTTAGSFKK